MLLCSLGTLLQVSGEYIHVSERPPPVTYTEITKAVRMT